jgi:hypothetical protein
MNVIGLGSGERGEGTQSFEHRVLCRSWYPLCFTCKYFCNKLIFLGCIRIQFTLPSPHSPRLKMTMQTPSWKANSCTDNQKISRFCEAKNYHVHKNPKRKQTCDSIFDTNCNDIYWVTFSVADDVRQIYYVLHILSLPLSQKKLQCEQNCCNFCL